MARSNRTVAQPCIAIGLSVLMQSGCVWERWPEQRGGGMAEMAPAGRSTLLSVGTEDPRRAVYAQVMAAEATLEALIAKGAMTYIPGETTLAKRLLVRVRREVAGNLISAARTDLIELEDRLAVIANRLTDLDVGLMRVARTI